MRKIGVFLFAASFVLMGVLYFLFNPSYQKSLQAKVQYILKDYKQANIYAQKAYTLNSYNKMAFSILTQSAIAMRYEEFINRGENFLNKIEKISHQENISAAQKAKIKIMTEIILDEYQTLQTSKLTNKELIFQANDIYKKFSKIYEELF